MKKSFIFVIITCAVFFTACSTPSAIVPTAINTVNSVRLSELNLERKDYKILNTITAEASVIYSQSLGTIVIKEADGDFSVTFKKEKVDGKTQWIYTGCTGVARYGFLTNDYANAGGGDDIHPEQMARNLAVYRLINACKVAGGDGVIEPVVSTNVGQEGRDIIFKTTVSAKVIKINVNK